MTDFLPNNLRWDDLRWNDYRFDDPWLLLLALLVPALILLRVLRRPRPAGIAFTRVAALGHVGGVRRALRWAPFALRLVAVALLVVALARPQRGRANATVQAEGIDIVLAVDISSSMRQRDFASRTRLEVAQDVLRRFIEGRADDRVGLVAFQEEARVLSPLTFDHTPLQRLVTTAGDLKLGDGTAIGMATAEAVNLLRDSRAKSRVVVLLTDGENNAGAIDPLPAARLAEAIGVRLYTIGVVGSGRNEVDEASLQKMADIGDGSYNRATDAEALANIYNRIGQLEKSRVSRDRFLAYDDLAPYALAAAVGLLAIEALLRATAFRRAP